MARYGAVVLTAFREVESSLANERLLALQLPLDQKALNDRTEAVRMATIQYKPGRRDLLWVAQLLSAALATEAGLIKVQSAQRVNRARSHQVLGSSFDAAPAANGRRPLRFVAVRWPRQAGMTRLTRRPLPSNRRRMPSCL